MTTAMAPHSQAAPIRLALGKARLTGRLRALATKYAVTQYGRGASIRGISVEMDRPYSTVRRLLFEADVLMRSRGGRRSSTWSASGVRQAARRPRWESKQVVEETREV